MNQRLKQNLFILLFACILFISITIMLDDTHPKSPPPIPTSYIKGGEYYVGIVHGEQDYSKHTNVRIKAFEMMQNEVHHDLYEKVIFWAIENGYPDVFLRFNGKKPDIPVDAINWWEAVLFANALSEWSGYTPYYMLNTTLPLRNLPDNPEEHILKTNPIANGYRLPTYSEWQVAARGGHMAVKNKTYGDVFSGSNQNQDVAWFPNNSDDHLHPIMKKKKNELAIYDLNGNVSEWLFDSIVGITNMKYYCGGSFNMGVNSIVQCDIHSRGFREDGLGFRLIKAADQESQIENQRQPVDT